MSVEFEFLRHLGHNSPSKYSAKGEFSYTIDSMLRDHTAITGERRRWARGEAKQVMKQALTDPYRRRVGARQTEKEKYRSVKKVNVNVNV